MASEEQSKVANDLAAAPSQWQLLYRSEDWLAVWLGCLLLAISACAVWIALPARELTEQDLKSDLPNRLKPWVATPKSWRQNPVDGLVPFKKRTQQEFDEDLPAQRDFGVLWGIGGAFVISCVGFAAGARMLGTRVVKFTPAFAVIFALAIVSYLMAEQAVVKHYNLEYALWALLVGLIISNTVGTPAFVRPAVMTEFYIKTGLVLLGAEVLLSELVRLGIPGIFVSWVVTPIVLITTFIFGQRLLKIESPTLNIVISADMSVCGVSAAIATAAACKAKKEELSLAIGLSLAFTVLMMVVMPAIIKAVGMSEILAGAWLGGTIDSTGAVAAAGGIVGPEALKVATTVKMIQNILIGVVAFGVAVYWTVYVERNENSTRPSVMEIWYRFPKFVLGFVAASAVFSYWYNASPADAHMVNATTAVTKSLRGWFFCLAFVSIGLETNFRELAQYFTGGKPLILYVCGQMLNLCLTLAMAWLMFEVLFRDQIAAYMK